LKNELGNVVALVTSKGVILPEGSKTNKERGMSIIKKRLGRDIKVLVATDVTSEGLNLQKANVLINYELIWSPIKVEQRLGRIWRYGQEKDVTSYVIVTNAKIDLDVLDIIYSKLIVMKESLGYDRPLMGEVVLVDNAIERDFSLGSPLFDEERGFDEYKALKEYLTGGREALDYYMRRVMKKILEMKEALTRLVPSSQEKRELFEQSKVMLGNLYGDKGKKVLTELAKKAFEVAGIEYKEHKNMIIKTAGERLAFENPVEALEYALHEVANEDSPLVYVVPAEKLYGLDELRVFKVSLKVVRKDKEYEAGTFETIVSYAVGTDKNALMDAFKTLEVLTSALDSMFPAVIVSKEQDGYTLIKNKTRVKLVNKKNAIGKYARYLSETEKRGYAKSTRTFVPRDVGSDVIVELREVLRIYGLKVGSSEGDAKPFQVEEVERRAMEIVMEFEIMNGRIPEDVSSREHYDIRSVDPETGEERFIEVKGRAFNTAEVILTQKEYEFAKKNLDKYWLYVVMDVYKDPKILIIKNPVPLLESCNKPCYVLKLERPSND